MLVDITSMTSIIKNPLCKQTINRLLKLHGSTTHFLERFAKTTIKVKISHQEEVRGNGSIKIYRESWLYCNDPDFPLFYCLAKLDKAKISSCEFKQVMKGNIPLGKIFDVNNMGQLHKSHIKIQCCNDPLKAKKLRTSLNVCYTKNYDLLVNKNKIGSVSEVMNEESISRVIA